MQAVMKDLPSLCCSWPVNALCCLYCSLAEGQCIKHVLYKGLCGTC